MKSPETPESENLLKLAGVRRNSYLSKAIFACARKSHRVGSRTRCVFDRLADPRGSLGSCRVYDYDGAAILKELEQATRERFENIGRDSSRIDRREFVHDKAWAVALIPVPIRDTDGVWEGAADSFWMWMVSLLVSFDSTADIGPENSTQRGLTCCFRTRPP